MAGQQAPAPVLDYQAGAMQATGGLIGDWTISYPDGTALTAGQAACLEDAKRRGYRSKSVTWTDAARKAAWAAFRARYGRRRR